MATASKGLQVQTFKGLNKKRMRKGTGNSNKVIIKQGDTATVQFAESIEDFTEFEQHSFQERGKWTYVPCIGDGCPLCADEDPDVAKTSYRFCCNVYVFKDKKILILEGPKDLAGRIAHRYEKGPKNFLRKVWDVSKYPTTPVSYDVEGVDSDVQRPTRLDGMDRHDHLEYLQGEITRYFGDDIPKASSSGGPSSLDDDDFDDEDEFDDEDALTEDDLLDMGPAALKEAAAEVGVKVKKVTKENRRKVISAILRRQ